MNIENIVTETNNLKVNKQRLGFELFMCVSYLENVVFDTDMIAR